MGSSKRVRRGKTRSLKLMSSQAASGLTVPDCCRHRRQRWRNRRRSPHTSGAPRSSTLLKEENLSELPEPPLHFDWQQSDRCVVLRSREAFDISNSGYCVSATGVDAALQPIINTPSTSS
jgi:hypothetical protein